MLTEKAQMIAKVKLGREITTSELRLMAYTQYQLMNEHTLDTRCINANEREILAMWRTEKYLKGGSSRGSLTVTKEFWDAMNDILFETYVDVE